MKLSAATEEAIRTAGAVVRVGYPWWLRPFLMKGVIAITLGKRIFLSDSLQNDRLDRLLRHELQHVRQVRRHGLVGFFARYVSEFFRHLWRERSVQTAYERISFEVEARAAEEAEPQSGL